MLIETARTEFKELEQKFNEYPSKTGKIVVSRVSKAGPDVGYDAEVETS